MGICHLFSNRVLVLVEENKKCKIKLLCMLIFENTQDVALCEQNNRKWKPFQDTWIFYMV